MMNRRQLRSAVGGCWLSPELGAGAGPRGLCLLSPLFFQGPSFTPSSCHLPEETKATHLGSRSALHPHPESGLLVPVLTLPCCPGRVG